MEDGSDTDYGAVGNSETESSGSDCDSFNKIKKKKKSKPRFFKIWMLIFVKLHNIFDY